MTRSLRAGLVWSTALGSALVLAGAGGGLYWLVRGRLWAQADLALLEKATLMVAAVEVERDGEVEMEDAVRNLPEFQPGSRPDYFELRRGDGLRVLASRSLGESTLNAQPPGPDTPQRRFAPVTLPDGRRGRLVEVCFAPRREGKAPASAAAPELFVLTLARAGEPLESTLAILRAVLMGVGAAALAACLGTLALAVRRGLKPLTQLACQIQGLREAGLGARVDPTGVPRELRPVADRLNELLAQLQESFAREQSFTSDVAHELRTPLAGLCSALEVSVSRTRDAQQYATTLHTCLAIAAQMRTMVENLLSLARLDARQVKVVAEPLDLADLIEECWRPHAAQARNRGLDVTWDLDGVETIRSDRALLAVVLRNLFDNAVSHSPCGQWVRVKAWTGTGVVSLAVSNPAEGLTDQDAARVFDRFWRKDPARGQAGHHCGLGLPVVQKAVAALGGQVHVECGGGVFTVTLSIGPVS